jgi:hypothetical protein
MHGDNGRFSAEQDVSVLVPSRRGLAGRQIAAAARTPPTRTSVLVDVGEGTSDCTTVIYDGSMAVNRHKSTAMSPSGCEQQISTLPSAGASTGSGR